MLTIELKPGIVNPEKIGALEGDLKTNFYDVKAKYFRADLPKGEQSRPKNIFPAEPGKANFITLRISRREGLEFYKAAFRSYAVVYSDNFEPDDFRRINESLMRNGFVKPPELPKVMMPVVHPPKPFYVEILNSLKDIISGIIGNLRK